MKKFLDSNGLLYLWQKITSLFVKKETGKGLSSNDYTTEEKEKLAGLSNYELPSDVVQDANYVHTDNNYTNAEKNKLGNLDTSLENKVDKVTGKGLSTNDYTTAEKTKLAGISASAEVNKIDSIKVNGTAQSITSKSVNITVPTNNNQLTNGAGYQTESEVQSLINAAIGSVTGISYKVEASLPSTGKAGVIYLIANNGKAPNIYDEYIWVDTKFEKIGTTDVDLSGYLKSSEVTAITNAEIDTILAS